MFDTHCHLNFQAFSDSFDSVIKTAQNENVSLMMIPGTDYEISKRAVEISEIYSGTYSAIGIHPTKDLENLDLNQSLIMLEELAKSPKVMAIGEIGLDYYRYRAGSVIQKMFFEHQLKLALKLNKSMIIHNRHASEDVLKILNKIRTENFEERVVFHCCEPDEILLDFAIKHNIYVGVDGDVTYDKAKQDFIKQVPLELLVVETDSPYIIPEPLRSTKKGVSNEPKNVKLVLEKISEIKNVDFEELVKITTGNGKRLFGI